MTDSAADKTISGRPAVDEATAMRFLADRFHIFGTVSPLPSYRDQNFHVAAEDHEYVLKINNPVDNDLQLEFENAALNLLSAPRFEVDVAKPVPNAEGQFITSIHDPSGREYHARVLTWVPGRMMADTDCDRQTQVSLGRMMGEVDRGLLTLPAPPLREDFLWDLASADRVVGARVSDLRDEKKRDLVLHVLRRFEEHVLPALGMLRHSVIQNDCNDYNVVVTTEGDRVTATGLIDFGDMVRTATIFELAIGCAYAILDSDDPVRDAGRVVAGYNERFPVMPPELDVLFDSIAMRLALSVSIAAANTSVEPENEYLSVSEQSAWRTLERLQTVDPESANAAFRKAAGYSKPVGRSVEQLARARKRFLGGALSTSYRNPLKIVRGAGQYLYDEDGRAYLDAVNNVPHVGHCHPRVVSAANAQMSRLNTNTRYLHDSIVEYAERLTAKFPGELNVCYLVNSGSEANDLALRMARAHTGGDQIVVLDGAYHGNLASLIDVSPYKHNGPGGADAPPGVHTVALPDPYRGPHRGYGKSTGSKYAAQVRSLLDETPDLSQNLAAFLAESIPGCGGQIVLPEGYLRRVYDVVRAHGGVCIADEVQVGFGRVGSHFWGFETQRVVPDIVTLGKPIGNGHPIGAVVTTEGIAQSFNTGMEYFNTYGGNPVSCEVALAVLDVIETEGLQQNALEVGAVLKEMLEELKTKHELIGDVRGMGLFLGIELVRDRETLEPATDEASAITEAMKDRGVLLSVDGPLHNVLKIKPPMVFTAANARRLVGDLDTVLGEM